MTDHPLRKALAALLGAIQRVSGATYVWSLCYKLQALDKGYDFDKTTQIAQRELKAIPDSIEAHFEWQMSEAQIQSERLGRRFDLGMALNESANRALAEKAKHAEPLKPQERLSSKQMAALAYQQEYLQKIVARS